MDSSREAAKPGVFKWTITRRGPVIADNGIAPGFRGQLPGVAESPEKTGQKRRAPAIGLEASGR